MDVPKGLKPVVGAAVVLTIAGSSYALVNQLNRPPPPPPPSHSTSITHGLSHLGGVTLHDAGKVGKVPLKLGQKAVDKGVHGVDGVVHAVDNWIP
jgi:hypothetical protein